MKGMRLWNLVCWAAVLLLVVPPALNGAFSPSSINYGHYEVQRLIALRFLMHAISFTLILGVLKGLMKEPPLPPPAPKAEPGPYHGPED